jgi:lipopolysaccharide/colanic/teichoic acid biosynthesis glycosyltransferase
LWNVLCGEMALIGPRPERPEIIPHLEINIPHYCDRMLVRPGISGLAQLQLPPDTDLASVRRKLAYDLYYVRHVSPWIDFRISLCTVLHLLGIRYVKLRSLIRVPAAALEFAHEATGALAISHVQSA